MFKIKDNNKTLKVIILSVLAIIVVSIGTMKLLDGNYKNQDIESKKEVKVSFQYKEPLQEEYDLIINQETKTIKTKDIDPLIDTNLTGNSKHIIRVDGVEILLNVSVEDSRKIEIDGDKEINVKVGSTREDVEKKIKSNVKIQKDKESEIVETLTYPEKFSLDKDGVAGIVTLSVRYKDNESNKSDIKIKVTVGETVDKEVRPQPEKTIPKELGVKVPRAERPNPPELKEPTVNPPKENDKPETARRIKITLKDQDMLPEILMDKFEGYNSEVTWLGYKANILLDSGTIIKEIKLEVNNISKEITITANGVDPEGKEYLSRLVGENKDLQLLLSNDAKVIKEELHNICSDFKNAFTIQQD